jgi:hypothetical protein
LSNNGLDAEYYLHPPASRHRQGHSVLGRLPEEEAMSRTRSHDEAVVEMIRKDPEFAVEYLRVAFEELDEEGGEVGFLAALRHLVEARGGMAEIAEKAGLP